MSLLLFSGWSIASITRISAFGGCRRIFLERIFGSQNEKDKNKKETKQQSQCLSYY
jgi:hypothetical protein